MLKKFCGDNEIDPQLNKYLSLNITKVLNYINAIKNLKLKNEEIELLNHIRENYL